MKLKKSFAMYHDYWGMFRLLTDEELGKIIRALFVYETEQKQPYSLDEKLNIIFYTVKDNLDRDKARHDAICDKNRQNAIIRWQKNSPNKQ